MENKNLNDLHVAKENTSIYFDLDLKLSSLKNKVEKILLVQPIQIDESQIDIKIALNKRYYMYPPYGLGILNSILKKNKFESDILDLNFETFDLIHNKNEFDPKKIKLNWQNILKKKILEFNPDLVGVSCTFTMNHKNMLDIF